MFKKIMEKFIGGDRQTRLMKKHAGTIELIKQYADEYRELGDHDFPGKTQEFVSRVDGGETLDDILPEAYGLVYETCRRLLGREIEVSGRKMKWDMVPFDVQLAGAIVLHEGTITEMVTGEGKTLVATMPLYLNALEKRGVHLVTVNDYLARRDSEWMGEIYRFLGMTVGALQDDMSLEEKKEAYQCDITYGTNNEFGFDYLRDNMKLSKDQQVQRGHNYAIIDEVDSVLIDEARTPLIISGPVSGSSQTRNYTVLRSKVERLVKKQKRLVNTMMSEVDRGIKNEEEFEEDDEIGVKLLLANRGDPKNKKFMKLRKRPGLEKLMLRVEADFMREKRLHQLDEELFYVVDEKSNTIDITEKGHNNLSEEDRKLFILPDISTEIKEIDTDDSLSPTERVKKKDRVFRKYAEKSDVIHNFHQLLKAYTLFEKDVEYVVQDDRVIIVDEFTGRLMPGRRFSEGLHQALEAKEGVKIEGETQTVATITLQNYFRMYSKLAGMTGTAETEEEEFHKIYALDVELVPTNKPVRRIDYDDVIFRTKREKYKAIIDEIERMHNNGLPILVGTVSVDVSETLSRMLRRKGIKHNVLNAKHHQKEAEIVAYAGREGAVTIATNMAGRGTDIKLGNGVVKCERCCIRCETPTQCGECPNPEKKTDCIEDVPCGLHIIGTERHESRRIDNQLRGRAGRQGDPGASRFFISLEDDLMRLFGSERISGVMDKMGVEEGDVITHPFITKAISNAQRKVETYNFGIRKRLLEYDDVMNKQREVIYGRRDEILDSDNLDDIISKTIELVVDEILEKYLPEDFLPEDWDPNRAVREMESIFLIPIEKSEVPEEVTDVDIIREIFMKKAFEALEIRKSTLPPDIMQQLGKMIMLRSIDEKWMDHLYELDNLKEGIHLRSYAQKDPLVEYKQEAFGMFTEMLDEIDKDIIWGLFHTSLDVGEERMSEDEIEAGKAIHSAASAYARSQASGQQRPISGDVSTAAGRRAGASGKKQVVREGKKIGRNDPCPCGSGKKYKKCCGRFK